MMDFYIMYILDGKPFNDLCLNCGPAYNMLVPHIGETFIDKTNSAEYEIVDVARMFDGSNRYGIQVMCKRREKRKYC